MLRLYTLKGYTMTKANKTNTTPAKTDTKDAVSVKWDNDAAQGVVISVAAFAGDDENDATDAAMHTVEFLRGATDEVKSKSRVKAMTGDFETESNNWKNATKSLVKALGVDPALVSIEGEPVWPNDEGDKPSTWQEADTDGMLAVYAPQAAEGFAKVEEGEGQVRSGSRSIGEAVAAASITLSAHMFDKWLNDASAKLSAFFVANKNAKGEFAFLGNLDQRFFDAVPTRAVSPKAFQKRYNDCKLFIADQAAEICGVDTKGDIEALPVTQAEETLIGLLVEMRDRVKTSYGGVSGPELNAFSAMHLEALENLEYDFLAKDEDGVFSPAKDGAGKYNVGGLTATKAGVANELVSSYCGALQREATRKAVMAETAERDTAKAQSDAVNPRAFDKYSIDTAVHHLATILSTHAEWAGILSVLGAMADQVDEGAAWDDVLSASRAGVMAEAEAKRVEGEGDDEA